MLGDAETEPVPIAMRGLALFVPVVEPRVIDLAPALNVPSRRLRVPQGAAVLHDLSQKHGLFACAHVLDRELREADVVPARLHLDLADLRRVVPTKVAPRALSTP